jgi:hypothetical protein
MVLLAQEMRFAVSTDDAGEYPEPSWCGADASEPLACTD